MADICLNLNASKVHEPSGPLMSDIKGKGDPDDGQGQHDQQNGHAEEEQCLVFLESPVPSTEVDDALTFS